MRRKVSNLLSHFAVRLPILDRGLREEAHYEYTIVNCPHAGQRAVFTARDGQPPRSHHRGHRDGENRDPAEAGRVAFRDWRTGLYGRCKRRFNRCGSGRHSVRKLLDRLKNIGITDWTPHNNPVVLWDIFGEKGHPVRATVSDLGPLLLARLLNLNDVQSGVLNIIFRIADDQGLLLLDFKDLRAITQYIGDNAKSFQNQYGNISSASVGAIQRGLLTLEQQGAEHFFGEPMLDIKDWMRTDSNGKGIINILSSEKLYQMPKLYAASLLWMLSELYEQLPEAGDLDKPKLVFFFDEAHLLFNDAPQVLLDKIEQVIRLIRSKGVGVWFVSQNPSDIPDNVLGQLGNRVQHALRAFTPKDQKAVKAAAQTMRANPAFDTEAAIQALGTGEALISFLDAKGSPSVVERAMVIAPCSRMGPVTDDERNGLINRSPLYGKYEDDVDRESAFEMLQKGYRPPPNPRTRLPPKASLLPWTTASWAGLRISCLVQPDHAAANAMASCKPWRKVQHGRSRIRLYAACWGAC